MINEHEYFSALSRDSRIFQSPEASRQTEYALADKLSSHHIQPLHPLQCSSMGEHFVHSTFLPSTSALFSWSPVSMCHPWLPSSRCPVVPLHGADPCLAPAPWHPASLRSRRLALGTTLGSSPAQSSDMFW